MSVLARRQLRQAALAAIERISGITVESPGDWDTVAAQLPNVKLRCGTERKSSITRTEPEFTTTVALEILARVEANSEGDAQDCIEQLGALIESALLGNVAFVKLCQQFSSVSTQTQISAEGKRHLGGIHMVIECEVFESFDPTEIAPGAYPALQQMNVHLDTAAPFDATGTYASPPYPASVTTAPRTTGPDGRDEAALQIDLPQ